MRIDIRPVKPGDVDSVVAMALRAWEPVHASLASALGERLNARVYPDWAHAQAAEVRDACIDSSTQMSVAVNAQTIVGFVTVLIDAPHDAGEIDMIAVDPPAQHQGVARALTEHALGQMRAAGCNLATVKTGGDTGHAPARALYESAGFSPLPLVRYYRQL